MKKLPKILVIDDDEGIRRVLFTILKDKGYDVDTAKDGEEAIEKTRNNFYNLALIDIRLPDMEGTELLKRLKDSTPKMVKIILTGYPALENAIDAVNRGADGYLIKPVNVSALAEKIEEHLKKQVESIKYSEGKVAQFIETRAKQVGYVPRAR
jgi:DNA-binding NtrC family response regulator